VEGPVPLSDEGPPGLPLGLPACANAKVPDIANAAANTNVVSFMVDSLLWARKVDRKAGDRCWANARTGCSIRNRIME
jgi:hypothetical protein